MSTSTEIQSNEQNPKAALMTAQKEGGVKDNGSRPAGLRRSNDDTKYYG